MTDDQFKRLRLLAGDDGMKRLQNAFVIVAGLGAVGGYAVEALARAGIGRLRLIDNDTVSLSNLNRQLFALHSTIGRPKTEIADTRVRDINPACVTETRQSFINAQSVPELFFGNPDFVVDAIDSLNPKTDLIAWLHQNDVPFISSMGAALRTDPRFISIDKMEKVHHCRLAHMLRKRLRHRGVKLDFPCVFSAQSREGIPAPRYSDESEQLPGMGRDRAVMGSLPTITGIFGLTLANYVICKIAGLDNVGRKS